MRTDFITLRKTIGCLEKTACIPHGELGRSITPKYFSAYISFAGRMLQDLMHPLQKHLNTQVCKRENGHLPCRLMTARTEAVKNSLSYPWYVLLTRLLLSCRISITKVLKLQCLFVCAPGLTISFEIKSYLALSLSRTDVIPLEEDSCHPCSRIVPKPTTTVEEDEEFYDVSLGLVSKSVMKSIAGHPTCTWFRKKVLLRAKYSSASTAFNPNPAYFPSNVKHRIPSTPFA